MHQLTANIMLTIIQALQLVGLVPSIFVILFLTALIKSNRQVIVPILYFMALACCFALPLIDLVPFGRNPWLKGGLLLGESMLVAFCFLLVMQFVLGRVPPLPYWLVLAIPLIGGSSIIFASLVQAGEVCLSPRACYDIEAIKVLYNIFASACIFLLLIYYSGRGKGVGGDEVTRKHKYALIISLILLHLFVLIADLVHLAGRLTTADTLFVTTVLKLTFIYLVITSLFRVFYPSMMGQVIQIAAPYVRAYNPELDRPHVEKIQSLLEIDRAYREMRLNRAALAKLVGINEHHLSRVINGHYGKNFHELINSYRIEEAKQRLKNEPDKQITVIGYEVGFNSIASFNRVFKDKVGMSPTDYRANNL